MGVEPIRTLLLIEADPAQQRLAAATAARAGWRTTTVAGEPGIKAALLGRWHDGSAAAIAALRASAPLLPVLACGEESRAVEAMRAGASDFLAQPLTADRLSIALTIAADRRGRNGELRPIADKKVAPLGFDEMVGSAPAFRAALAIAAKAARSRVPVLIEGERGTGKETLARAIHASGPRGQKPLILADCAAVVPALAGSFLFGHEKAAFPGAFDRHVGRIEAADGATLFLDNVEELPADVQAMLLEFAATGELSRLGGRGFKPVDVRLIAAAGKPLAEEVAKGRFREDLYRRLAMVQVPLPPLRERRGDIPGLARHFLARMARQPGLPPLGLTDDALALLAGFGWPGNVRQLQEALFRAALRCEGPVLTAADFPQIARESGFSRRAGDFPAAAPSAPELAHAPAVSLYRPDGHLRALEEIEADIIRLAIGRYEGRMTEVARRLGIGRSTLYRKLAELGILDAA